MEAAITNFEPPTEIAEQVAKIADEIADKLQDLAGTVGDLERAREKKIGHEWKRLEGLEDAVRPDSINDLGIRIHGGHDERALPSDWRSCWREECRASQDLMLELA